MNTKSFLNLVIISLLMVVFAWVSKTVFSKL